MAFNFLFASFLSKGQIMGNDKLVAYSPLISSIKNKLSDVEGMNVNQFSFKSLGNEGFPGVVKTFKFSSINDSITVGIAVGVSEVKDCENLVCV